MATPFFTPIFGPREGGADEDSPSTGSILFDVVAANDADDDHVTYRYDGKSVFFRSTGMEM